MDIISHGLWGSAAFGRKNRMSFALAFIFSLLPDIFGEGVMFLLIFLGLDNMPSLQYGHPNVTDFPAYVQNFYNATHSLIIFLSAFAAVWMFRKKPFLPLAAWGLHILIDIPTHSFKLFPTPFLWPISDFKINGLNWGSPFIFIPNVALLIILYSFWLYRRRNKYATDKNRICSAEKAGALDCALRKIIHNPKKYE